MLWVQHERLGIEDLEPVGCFHGKASQQGMQWLMYCLH